MKRPVNGLISLEVLDDEYREWVLQDAEDEDLVEFIVEDCGNDLSNLMENAWEDSFEVLATETNRVVNVLFKKKHLIYIPESETQEDEHFLVHQDNLIYWDDEGDVYYSEGDVEDVE